MSKPKIALIAVAVPWFDTEAASRHLRETRAALTESYDVLGPEELITDDVQLERFIKDMQLQRPHALLLQIGTFPDGNAPAQLAEALRIPIILHGIPEPELTTRVPINSLCGLNMSTFTLTALEHPHSYVIGKTDSPETHRQLHAHLNAAVALAKLHGKRLGLIGFRAPGFYPCAFDELALRRTFGVRIEHVGLHEMTSRLRPDARKAAPHSSFPTIEGGVLQEDAIAWMERYYAAVAELVTDHQFDLIAIKDWPEIEHFDPEIPGGFWPALSWLQNDGVNIAPEGDVNGALTMQLEHELTGGLPFFADISAFDEDASTLTLWHYGGATQLARSAEEIRFGEEGREVEFTLKPGQAVLARLGYYRNAYRLLTIDIEVLDEAVTLRRAGAKVRTTRSSARAVLDELLNGGWEHHVCLIHGDCTSSLQAFAKFAGIPVTSL